MTASKKEASPVGAKVWSRPRRLLALGILLVGVVLAAVIGGYHWLHEDIPEPPVVELTKLEPSAVAVIQAARAAVIQSPHSAEAWGRLGVLLLTCSYYPEARACFAYAERLNPRDLRWPYLQAQAYAVNDPEAIPKLQRALDLDPQPPDSVRLHLAETLLAQGRLDEAEQHFRVALQQDSANSRAHLGLARLAFARGHLDESLASLQHAAVSPFTQKAACVLLAQVHRAAGDTAAAAQDEQRLSHLPEDRPVLSLHFARETGQLLENKIALSRVNQMVLQGRPAEAEAILRQQTAKYPDWGRAWLTLGQVLIWGQNYVAAEAALRKAAGLLPDSAQPHCHLGTALTEQGRHQEAVAAFRQALDLQPDYAEAYFGLSGCLQAQRDRSGAEQALRAAIRYLPTYAQARAALGELLAQSGRLAEGVEHLRCAACLQPDDEKLHKLLLQWEPQSPAVAMPQETFKK